MGKNKLNSKNPGKSKNPIYKKVGVGAPLKTKSKAKQVKTSLKQRLSLECVGNFGKQAMRRAAMAILEVDKEKRPPPRNRNPRAMWMVKWEPYL
ncbi:hypothetical protein E2C01_026513 [Portunus trituberculatus]|uniref:Uncharacterized protein n=1 Tax=Portunus trituberculatus TaxID=210409 RepID=A0A5B7EFL3_PORTR|nr:hypothetical protein [Portunus trituberculatus]